MAAPSIKTRFTETYGVDHPIACAAMAFAGMWPPLPIAVANAGCFASFPVGKMPGAAVRANIEAIRAETDGPLNLNLITIFAEPEHIEVIEEQRPEVVSFHWEIPRREWIDRIKAAGAKVWMQVGSADDARRALDAGFDLIVAQGSEAGGHNYDILPTFVGLPEIVAACDGALVLAGGGVASGRSLAAVLALGADGAWVGTRFIATEEGNAPPEFKERLVARTGGGTVMTSLFGPDHPEFNPMRVLRNRITQDYAGREHEAPASMEGQPVIGEMTLLGQKMPLQRFGSFVPMADDTGDFDELPLPAGQGVGQIDAVRPVAAVVETMIAEARETLTRLAASVT